MVLNSSISAAHDCVWLNTEFGLYICMNMHECVFMHVYKWVNLKHSPGEILLHLLCLYYIREKLIELPLIRLSRGVICIAEITSSIKLEMLTLEVPSPSHSSNLTLFVPLFLLCCQVYLSDKHFVILEIIQVCFFSSQSCVAVLPWEAFQMRFLWSGSGFIHEKTHIIHAHVHTITWTHTCTEGISACLRLKQTCQSCLCVSKSHSQRAFYPPRLRGPWHWQGMHTQRHKHNLHAWCNVKSLEQTHTFGYMKEHCTVSTLISETVLLHSCSSSSWVVCYIQQ